MWALLIGATTNDTTAQFTYTAAGTAVTVKVPVALGTTVLPMTGAPYAIADVGTAVTSQRRLERPLMLSSVKLKQDETQASAARPACTFQVVQLAGVTRPAKPCNRPLHAKKRCYVTRGGQV